MTNLLISKKGGKKEGKIPKKKKTVPKKIKRILKKEKKSHVSIYGNAQFNDIQKRGTQKSEPKKEKKKNPKKERGRGEAVQFFFNVERYSISSSKYKHIRGTWSNSVFIIRYLFCIIILCFHNFQYTFINFMNLPILCHIIL
jgi:hypothetical protein